MYVYVYIYVKCVYIYIYIYIYYIYIYIHIHVYLCMDNLNWLVGECSIALSQAIGQSLPRSLIMAQEQKSTRCKEQKAPKNTSCPRAARPFSMHVCIPQKELDNLVVSSRVYVSKVLLLLLLVVMVLFLLLLLGKKRIPWCLGQTFACNRKVFRNHSIDVGLSENYVIIPKSVADSSCPWLNCYVGKCWGYTPCLDKANA